MSYFAARVMNRTSYNPYAFGMRSGWGMGSPWWGGGHQNSVFGGNHVGVPTRIGLRHTSVGNPFAHSRVGVNANGIGVGSTHTPFGARTGIYNAQTGTRFGQLTTPNGVRTAVSANVYNYAQRVERNPFATRTTTRFEDDRYIYNVRNTRSNGWVA